MNLAAESTLGSKEALTPGSVRGLSLASLASRVRARRVRSRVVHPPLLLCVCVCVRVPLCVCVLQIDQLLRGK